MSLKFCGSRQSQIHLVYIRPRFPCIFQNYKFNLKFTVDLLQCLWGTNIMQLLINKSLAFQDPQCFFTVRTDTCFGISSPEDSTINILVCFLRFSVNEYVYICSYLCQNVYSCLQSVCCNSQCWMEPYCLCQQVVLLLAVMCWKYGIPSSALLL